MSKRDYTRHRRKRIYPRQSLREQAATAQRKDLEAQLDTALKLLHWKGKRIADLAQRLEIAIDANQTLRVENAALKLADDRRTRQVVDATLRKVDEL